MTKSGDTFTPGCTYTHTHSGLHATLWSLFLSLSPHPHFDSPFLPLSSPTPNRICVIKESSGKACAWQTAKCLMATCRVQIPSLLNMCSVSTMFPVLSSVPLAVASVSQPVKWASKKHVSFKKGDLKNDSWPKRTDHFIHCRV